MRKHSILMALTVVCSGCASGGPRFVTAPAPEGALTCALRQATQLGYTPTQGGLSDGYIKFTSKIGYRPADAGKEGLTRIASLGMKGSNRATENYLTTTAAAGILRVEFVTLYENKKLGKPTDQVTADAEGILAACGTPTDPNRVSR